MRVTCDIDSNNKLELLFSIFKGLLVCRKFPEIEKSQRGYHLIWKELNISFEKSLAYRKFIGDDDSRLKFDMNPKRVGQVLFNSKQVWIKNVKTKKWEKMKYCRICGTPLPHFWVYRENNYYCINCGRKKDVILLEKLNDYKEKRFTQFLLLIHRLLLPLEYVLQ
jgi:DNA-directed RNA polymerase beta' subunit